MYSKSSAKNSRYDIPLLLKPPQKDLTYYKSCLQALEELSKGAKIFCLIHKMDLLAESKREKIFEQRRQEILDASGSFNVTCFKTSIWDETLYKVIIA